jgi:hypothetical protein
LVLCVCVRACVCVCLGAKAAALVAATLVIYGVSPSTSSAVLAGGCGASVLPLLLWLRYVHSAG